MFFKIVVLLPQSYNNFGKNLQKMKTKQRIRRYFKNLFTALVGNNPYQMEQDRLREEYEKTVDKVRQLDELYWVFKEKQAEADKQMASYQVLVENLRQRLAEKDELIDQIKKDYQQRIADNQQRITSYSETIARLQDELQKKNTPET